tara:strand:- start:61 stop:237 length:177 start_codon:yes stop_codon:yes gene_type:complete
LTDDGAGDGQHTRKILSIPFLKKYILYAKKRAAPRMSQQASEFIAKAYTELRSKEGWD